MKESKIFRTVKQRDYVTMSKVHLLDKSLSLQAKGLLSYMLCMVDTWEFYLKELASHSTNGRDSTQSAFNELVRAKYVIRKPKRDKGRFAGYDYFVYELPQNISDSTETGKTVSGKTVSGKTVSGKTVSGKSVTNKYLSKVSNNLNTHTQKKFIDFYFKDFNSFLKYKSSFPDNIDLQKLYTKVFNYCMSNSILKTETEFVFYAQMFLNNDFKQYKLKNGTKSSKTKNLSIQAKIEPYYLKLSEKGLWRIEYNRMMQKDPENLLTILENICTYE